MDNEDKKNLGEEAEENAESQQGEETETPSSEAEKDEAPRFSREGMQSADAMFGQEAAVSGIIPGLTDREITDEVRTAFLDYSMSVIVSRAIPDVRDGFKPVQRRIISFLDDVKQPDPGLLHKICSPCLCSHRIEIR